LQRLPKSARFREKAPRKEARRGETQRKGKMREKKEGKGGMDRRGRACRNMTDSEKKNM